MWREVEVELSEEQLHVARRFGAADQGSLLRGQGVERFFGGQGKVGVKQSTP